MGAILFFLWFIPFLGIVGIILLLIAVKYISEITQDRSVFDNFLYATIAIIVGLLVLSLLILLPLYGFGIIDGGLPPLQEDLVAYFIAAILILVGITIVFTISAFFLRRSLDSIARHLNVPLFGTAGLLYFLGAVLIIAFGVGLILLFIADILLIVAFFSIQEPQPAPVMAEPPAAP